MIFFSWSLVLAVFQDKHWNCNTKNNLIQYILPERIYQDTLEMICKILIYLFIFYLLRKPQWQGTDGDFTVYILPSSGCSSHRKVAHFSISSVLGTKWWAQHGGKPDRKKTLDTIFYALRYSNLGVIRAIWRQRCTIRAAVWQYFCEKRVFLERW